ncbi:hypothetical protein AB0E63_38620 [Kribbella sp. NPDC026596]|uniref:DUF4304 domain-containing protein n=1 Tax=Kribbella sp. NPDC026596 TaxID=3155122 RepID=UPI0033DF33D0
MNTSDWAEARSARPHLPERPAPGLIYGGDFAVCARIGKLTLDGSDKWWRVYGDVDVAAVVADVLDDVREYATPWFAEQMRARGCR